MTDQAHWLPKLIRLDDYDGNWRRYIEAVFAIFHHDFIASQPQFDSKWIRCRRDPIYDGKEAGFWHCTSEGPNEEERTPDLRRCERIAWVRSVIEHHTTPEVQVWTVQKRRDRRVHIWYAEEYLIVLGARRTQYQLITAFCTDRRHTREKLRRERDRARNG